MHVSFLKYIATTNTTLNFNIHEDLAAWVLLLKHNMALKAWLI